ncbi:hypothetical protein PRIC2_013195 [Phytophthora ramorum]
MLKRYVRLRDFISTDDEDLEDYLSSRTTRRKLEMLLTSLHNVESVSKHLEATGLTLIAPDADLMHLVAFEHAVENVLAGQTTLLTDNEAAALEPSKRRPSGISVMEPPASGKKRFAELILKHRKRSRLETVLVLMAMAEVAEVDEKEGLLRSVVVASARARWRATTTWYLCKPQKGERRTGRRRVRRHSMRHPELHSL